MTLHLEDTRITGSRSDGEGGSAIFFVSNDRSGDVAIVDSVLRGNTGGWVLHAPGHLLPGPQHHVDARDGGAGAGLHLRPQAEQAAQRPPHPRSL